MDPITAISLGITATMKAFEIYERWSKLRAARAAGQQVTEADLDALFAEPALDYDKAINDEVAKRTESNPDWPKQPLQT